ncbi:MAG TPA: hypothetical protein PKB15_06815 [Acidimicrobiia bacterium]|nr:hypothetical protein [Acidimicrobiia bacterium]
MLFSVFSPKGGVGTTVSSVLFAKSCAQSVPTLVIDACEGDLEAVVASDIEPRYCFDDWVNSAEPTSTSLEKISVPLKHNLDFVAGSVRDPASSGKGVSSSRGGENDGIRRQQIIDALTQREGDCVIDLGNRADDLAQEIIQSSDIVVMVLRQCYLGLWRAMTHTFREHVDVCVVIRESGRSIASNEIARTLGVLTVIEIDARRDFARTIDAGVLIHRTPEKLIGPVSSYVNDIKDEKHELRVDNDVFEDASFRNSQPFWRDKESIRSVPQQKAERSSSREKFVLDKTYSQHLLSSLKDRG